MIGNLGKVAYQTLSNNDGNSGNNGNVTSEPAQILHQQEKHLIPWRQSRTGTAGTSGEISMPVPVVPELQVRIGNTSADTNNTEKHTVIQTVPVVPAVPATNTVTTDNLTPLHISKGHGIWRLADIVGERDVISAEREVCYCCKGTDFWIAGTEEDPYRLCRKCRPPIPGAERIPNKT